VGGGGSKEDAGAGEVGGRAPAGGGGAGFDPVVERGVGGEGRGEVGEDVAGGESVDLDVVRGPFGAHGAGEHFESTLGGGVVAGGGAGEIAHERADVDELAAGTGEHGAGGGAAGEEGGGEVGLKHGAPVGERHVGERRAAVDAGVVDEDVERAVVAGEGGEGDVHGGFVGDVEGERGDIVPGGAQ